MSERAGCAPAARRGAPNLRPRFAHEALTPRRARRAAARSSDDGSPRAPGTPNREDDDAPGGAPLGAAPAELMEAHFPSSVAASSSAAAASTSGAPAQPALKLLRTRASASAPDIGAWHRAMLCATLAAREEPEVAPQAQPQAEELRRWRPSLSSSNLMA
jgi:hypothetical protein